MNSLNTSGLHLNNSCLPGKTPRLAATRISSRGISLFTPRERFPGCRNPTVYGFHQTTETPNGSDANKYAESQLLLTRSKDLTQKLKLYTKRLINTRLGIIAGDQRGEDDKGFAQEFGKDTTRDLLSLNDDSLHI